jgi:hypothetical protein
VSQLRIFVSADSENAAGARRRFRRVRGLRRHHGQLEFDGGTDLHADQAKGRRHLSSAMDTEHRVIAELLALKDALDDVLVDQVQAIGASQQPL